MYLYKIIRKDGTIRKMNGGIKSLEMASHFVFITAIIILALLVLLCLVRAVIGPRVADRIVTVNMMGTMVMVIISILSIMMKESYLVDICLIYAMISFLAVIVISKVYLGVYNENEIRREEKKDGSIGMD